MPVDLLPDIKPSGAGIGAPVDLLPDVATDGIPRMLPRQRAVALAGVAPGSLDPVAIAAGLGAGTGKVALGAQYLLGRGVKALGDVADRISPPDQTLSSLVTGQAPQGTVARAGNWLVNDATTGRANLDAQLAPYRKESPKSAGLGEVGGEMLTTLPVGGALAKGAEIVGLGRSLPRFAEAVRTFGMRTGAKPANVVQGASDLGIRSAGGALTGGVSSALVDPDSGWTGAGIGAALPPALKVMGVGARAVGATAGAVADEVRAAVQSESTTAARELMRALDLTPDQLPAAIAKLRGAQTLVQGSTPTVAQALTTPQSAILERVVAAGPGGEQLRQSLLDQVQAGVKALRGVEPSAAGMTSAEAARNLGDTAAAEGMEVRGWVKSARDEKYGSDALVNSTITLPGKNNARAAVEKFYPGVDYQNAPADLQRFVARLDSGEPIPFPEFDALRKRASNAARKAATDNDATLASAWDGVKGLFNDAERAAQANAARLVPTGQGQFGPVYGGLAGDPENAIAHLLRTRTGEVPGAASHPFAGPIDLVSGDSKMGLQHIEGQGRGQVLLDLPDLLRNGTWYSRPNSGPGRTYLGNPDTEAVVRMQWDGNAKQWVPTAYERGPGNRYPLETGRTTNGADAASGPLSPGNQAGNSTLPDIETAFNAFDQSLKPAPRNPGQYTGDLAGGVLSPEASADIAAGRSLHQDMMNRWGTGPWYQARNIGADGRPLAQGQKLGETFVNGGSNQLINVQALKNGVLDRGPTMQAAREYAMSDLLEKSVNDKGELLVGTLRRNLDSRSLMLKELFSPEQLQTLQSVLEDAARASATARRGIRPGDSTTYSNAANALDAGLLGSPFAKAVAARIPAVRAFAEPIRVSMAESASKAKAKRLAGLLSDAGVAADALSGQVLSPSAAAARAQSAAFQGLLSELPWLRPSNAIPWWTYHALPILPASQR